MLAMHQGRLTLRGVPRAAWTVLVLGGASLVASAAVGSAGSNVSHGGRYFEFPGPAVYARSVVQNGAIVAFAGAAWVAPVVVLGLARTRSWAVPALLSLLALLLTVPQLLLYSLQGIMEGKYEDIAGLGTAAWMMAGLVLLGRRGSLSLYKAGLAVWAATVVGFGVSTWSYATYFAQESLQLRRLVTTVATVVPNAEEFGIAADAGRQYEPVVSLIEHISHQGRSDVKASLVALPSDRPYTQIEADLDDTLRQQLPPPDSETCRGIGAVVVLGNEAHARAALPCADAFERLEFSSVVWLWGGEGVSLRPRLPGTTRVGYVLLVPPDASVLRTRLGALT